mmetsp:Transcript_34894/g.100240  ORF Transcript_34894/g.100240 Transcript_34894/m.100240 type:complete len:225 (+) Transcript_34894:506-1180(+)
MGLARWRTSGRAAFRRTGANRHRRVLTCISRRRALGAAGRPDDGVPGACPDDGLVGEGLGLSEHVDALGDRVHEARAVEVWEDGLRPDADASIYSLEDLRHAIQADVLQANCQVVLTLGVHQQDDVPRLPELQRAELHATAPGGLRHDLVSEHLLDRAAVPGLQVEVGLAAEGDEQVAEGVDEDRANETGVRNERVGAVPGVCQINQQAAVDAVAETEGVDRAR